MKKHTKVYLDFFGYDISSFIPCEVCGDKAVDIHHVECRGAGGAGGSKDRPDNLMAVCRSCHLKYGDKTQYMEFLKEKHAERMNNQTTI